MNRDPHPGPRPGRPRTPRWRLARPALALAALALAAAFAWPFIPPPERILAPHSRTLTLLDRNGSTIAEIPSDEARSHRPIPLDAMGEWMPRITVAIEDHRFYRHHGVDWVALGGAIARAIRAGHPVGGASTITQQCVKLSSPQTRRGPLQKLREISLAPRLERAADKRAILESYLNQLDYGNRLVGPESAAMAYFSKPARELTLPEAAYLAGIPQAPTRHNPWTHPAVALARYAITLRRLAALGLIDEEARARHENAPPQVLRAPPRDVAPHFARAAAERLGDARGPRRATLDLDLQRVAEQLVRAHLQRLRRHDVTAAAMVVIDNASSDVRALVGSPDFQRDQIDGTRSHRSCGSILKPFVYLMAIDARLLTAGSILPDTAEAIRERFPDYDPQNYDGRFLGPVRVRQALACSLNVPAVVALEKVGPRRAFLALARWGVDFARDFDSCGAGFILGNAEVTLLSVTAAYAGLARGGIASAPRLLETEHPPLRQMASAPATAIVLDILRDDRARQPAFGTSSPLASDGRLAAKTGTSSSFRDAWTIGFDRDHTVGVWVGNFDGRPIGESLAIRVAAPLWRDMMDHLLRHDTPLSDPAPSEGLVRLQICPLTGLLPAPRGPSPIAEWFLPGTQPAGDAASRIDLTPDGRVTPLLPPEFAAWCDSPHNHIGARCAPTDPLRILHPNEGAKFQIDPILPETQQMLAPRSNRDGRAPVSWSIQGRPLPARTDGSVLWQLAPGRWTLRARSGTDAASVTFEVVAAPPS